MVISIIPNLTLYENLLLHSRYHGYRTYSIHPVEEILPILQEIRAQKETAQHVESVRTLGARKIRVKLGSTRLMTYTKSLMCALCGEFKIECFVVQKNSLGPHLNPYGSNASGHIRMFTSDHIIPKARGGPDSLENRQPACEKCNTNKRDRLPGEVMSPNELAEREMARARIIAEGRMHPDDDQETIRLKQILSARYNGLHRYATHIEKEQGLPAPDKFGMDYMIKLYACRGRQTNLGVSTLLSMRSAQWELNNDDIKRLIMSADLVKEVYPQLRRRCLLGQIDNLV